jgi:NAD(P)-dependent dehydrogenase (short-subunit alcohol dehydrogenase family)
MKLENKVALVNGADSGIGNEIAKLFAEEGASVVLVARKKEDLEDILNQINADGGRAIAVDGTASNEEDVQRAINTALDAFGKLDIIIKSVKIADIISPVADMGEGIWKVDLNVDLTGAI